MKTIEQIEQEYQDAIAYALIAAAAKRKQQYIATRSHFPHLPAHLIIDAIRNGNHIVRDYKKCSPYNPRFTPEGYRALHCRWIENWREAGLRFVEYADNLDKSIQHKGWFADPWGDGDTFRGAVWQLPARNGCAQYVFGYEDPNNDMAALIEFDLVEGTRGYDQSSSWDTDDMLIAAARDADQFAERMAESEREYQLKACAEQRADELKAEAQELREDLCGTIRAEREKISALLDEARDILDNPYQLLHS